MTDSKAPTTEDFLQFLYLTPVGVVKFRANGTVELMNPVAVALLLSIAPAQPLRDIYAALAILMPDLGQRVALFTGPAGTIVGQQRLEARAGGQALVLSLSVNKVSDDVYMAVLEDVTRLTQQESKLRTDRQKFFAIFDHVREYAIYTTSVEGIVDEWNQSVQRFSGWLEADLQGRSMALLFSTDYLDQRRIDALLFAAKNSGSVETEGWCLKRDGTRIWANTVITALPDEAGSVRGFVVVSRDMTERKRLEDELTRLAAVDPLTGAYNRRKGNALLAVEFGRHARTGRAFAVLLLDIDHFKSINDRFGHPAGDDVLCALVQACRSLLRITDILIRWGGEEFLFVLPDTDASAAVAIAERMRASLAAAEIAAPGGAPIRFTVSIGVAVPTGENPGELLSRADIALYAAKMGGRDRVELAA